MLDAMGAAALRLLHDTLRSNNGVSPRPMKQRGSFGGERKG